MSNRFLCDFNKTTNINLFWDFVGYGFLNQNKVNCRGYYFFSCAEPLATSASIENGRTNLREYYVKRIKIDFFARADLNYAYMMVFVLNVPDSYTVASINPFTLSDLPSHTIPECVLYYNLFRGAKKTGGAVCTFDIRIDIKKPFKVSPSHRLAFLCFLFNDNITPGVSPIKPEGAAEVFFEVN